MKLSKIKLHNKERLDDLIHDNLKIIQHKNHFSFGIDAVLLADFVDVKPGDKIIDLGTGTGVIPLLLTAKSDPGQVLGIELQAELVDMAKRSVLYNNLEEFIQIKRADITELKNQLRAESFEVVASNPPYMPLGQGKVNPERQLAIARHEIKITLKEVVGASAYLLKYGGKASYVYRPERLDELLLLMRENNLQPKKLRFIYPKKDEECNLVLVTGVKGANYGLVIEEPLIVYQDDGEYTLEIMEIYYGSDFNKEME
jgi:tRNA1(Val) A37 N6-methylase TrmN6